MAIKTIQGKPRRTYDFEAGDSAKTTKRKEKIEYRLPEFEITSEDLPEVKDWKIGEKYTIQIEVELTEAKSLKMGDLLSGNCICEGGETDKEETADEKKPISLATLKITGVETKVEPKAPEKKKDSVFGEMKGGANKIG
jgi:hypothetical protein